MFARNKLISLGYSDQLIPKHLACLPPDSPQAYIEIATITSYRLEESLEGDKPNVLVYIL